MKSLMMIAVAALCTVAFAKGPEKVDAPKGDASVEKSVREKGPRHGGMRNGQMPRGGMPGMADPLLRAVNNPRIAEKLGLSDDQKAKLKELSGDRKANRENQKKVREATMKQFELMKADKIDEAAVMATIDEVFELRKQMAKDQVKRLIAVKSILTPEQIAKAHEEMKAGFRNRGQGRDGMKGGRRGKQKGEKGPKGGDKSAPKSE